MTSKESFLMMWDIEVAATKRVLGAMPEKNIEWRPHPKSRSAADCST